eukprot:IDg12625t1
MYSISLYMVAETAVRGMNPSKHGPEFSTALNNRPLKGSLPLLSWLFDDRAYFNSLLVAFNLPCARCWQFNYTATARMYRLSRARLRQRALEAVGLSRQPLLAARVTLQ